MGERVRFAVVHGRFQPFHLEHLAYCELALRRGDALVVGITNFDPALFEVEAANPRRHEPAANPFSYWERTLMIRDALLQAGVPPARFTLVALPIHHPERWPDYVPTDPRHALHILRVFSAWEEEKARRLAAAGWRVEAIRGEAKVIAATEVRARIAANQPWEHLVPEAVRAWIMRLDGAARLRRLHVQAASDVNGK
jgi:nicotinamide-nucleotide adenylyltransferase